MQYPLVTLGGIPIPAEAGAPDFSRDPLQGATVVRMSDGAAVKMTHWSGKTSGQLSGSGLVPLGLDGIDYSRPLDLLLTHPRSMAQAAPSFVLPAPCRSDREPWGLALVEGRWRPVPCTRSGLNVDLVIIPGATLYMVQWMPAYRVFADPPQETMGTGHGWTLNWQEV
ncbi:hypothetical protein NK553_18435 [Pseudomonas sp. ZM23]|uniref:Uncharacterized protein n=1 Tax=Pseudomonas triclosanedens TaxID=2961893 RepID=A0ABY6ZTT3_9PSED|nr:hypothetical protein [Pseudomonas triclosanedens]MCP8465933.1 hypothetical protein [Pseudomonas triclosanedens]MCP8472254.1 hypothetical protein [Pseudomonas triclosanedens]MCP8477232.1 hypothetical protein [Pseudomonas triclosanedens]WAI47430.1 hypothetical protein OU419_16780 [Pseudomonas triclosanedens]